MYTLKILQHLEKPIGSNVLEKNEQSSRPSRTAEEILGAHLMNNDNFWKGNKLSDISIDTANKKEMMTGSHTTEHHTHKYLSPVPPELSNVVSNKPQTYDLPQNYQLDSTNKFKDLNILSKTSNVTCTLGTNLLSQESQDYYNQHDQ